MKKLVQSLKSVDGHTVKNKPNFYIYVGTVILQNYSFWLTNIDELDKWLKSTKNGKRNNMTVTGLNPKELTVFSLRWS